MKRPLRAEETRLWAVVARTVRPSPGRTVPELQLEPSPPSAASRTPPPALAPAPQAPARQAYAPPEDIEPRRRQRIVRGRDAIEARLDLHGLDQDRARAVLATFLHRAQDQGLRAVLIITGKGLSGDGVLRRRAPEWLADPVLRPLIAGYSQADRRHGGEGALYVALKRKAAPTP